MQDIAIMEGFKTDTSAVRLTETILGYSSHDLSDTLKIIASEIGVSHIAYVRFASDKSSDTSLLTGIFTYSREWQARYFLKQYVALDPVIAYARNAVRPFDWETLGDEDPAALAFLADAANHGVGRNGLSIPVRNRRGLTRLYPSPAIKRERSGFDISEIRWCTCSCCLFLSIRRQTSISNCPRRSSACRGAKSNV